MHQDSWLRPNLADGWSAWASDTAPAAQPGPRSRVALDTVVTGPATFPPSQGLARIGKAVALGSAGPDVWGDAARLAAATAARAQNATSLRAASALPKAAAVAIDPRRPAANQSPNVRAAKPASERPHSAGPRARPRLFEFIGHGALSVTSSITGKHYRFTEHGIQLAVDPRDWSQLSRVPSLRAVVV